MLAAALLSSEKAEAHLSIIRQGVESAQFPEDGDRHGSAVAAGDFNGDGHDDLAIGSPNEDASTWFDSGLVTINYGAAHGLTHAGATQLHSGDFGVVQNTGALFGASLAVADLNGDGFDDLIVGAPGETRLSAANAGRIYIYAGSVAGLLDWTAFHQEDLGGVSLEHDRFGFSLTTGHFNNDPYRDIAVGSPSNDVREGFVFVRYGSATGPFGGSVVLSSELLGASLDVGDHFGYSLAAGNTIGGTHEDLVIGAPFRKAFGSLHAGVCFVVPGGSSGLNLPGNVRFTAKVRDDVSANSAFGFSLAILEQGLYDRIVVGEPKRTIGPIEKAGRVVVVKTGADGPVYGSTDGLTQEVFGGANEALDEFGTTVATGYFEDDGWMDVAIGAPNKDLGVANAGTVYLAYGGGAELGNNGYHVFTQNAIGELVGEGDQAGAALAFGAFDATDQGTLVIGVPGEFNEQGLVHIVAPWRQYTFQSHKTAFVTDCQGDIIFSQKPFQRVFIASTTKIMTVLIACERSQLPTGHPAYKSLDALYTVPDWVAEDIGGSTANLIEGEIISLRDLMYLALMISGNDAAHAIADMLQGPADPWESIPAFVAEMNDRADALGMDDTGFSTPNGFEHSVVGPNLGENHSTAYDMEMLSRAAMLNPLFRDFSNTSQQTVTRIRHGITVEQELNSFQTWIHDNQWGMNGTGIKGGSTPAARTTWCVSAEDHGRVIATSFGTPTGAPARSDALRLLTLGMNDCGTWNVDPDWELEYLHVSDGISAVVNSHQYYSMAPTVPYNMNLELFHASADVLPTIAYMRLRRESQLEIDTNETIPYGIGPFGGLEEILITNEADWEMKLWVEVNGEGAFYDLMPGETLDLPAAASPGAQFQWSVRSHGPGPAPLSVREVYSYDVGIPAEPTPNAIMSLEIERNLETSNDLLTLEIDWHADGGDYVLAVHEPGVVVGVEDPPVAGGSVGSALRLSPPMPNPFSGETRIRFTLDTAAEVGVSIYDAAGRRVRQFAERPRPSGAWSVAWNGRDENGRETAPGVYFYQVTLDGLHAGGGKLARLR